MNIDCYVICYGFNTLYITQYCVILYQCEKYCFLPALILQNYIMLSTVLNLLLYKIENDKFIKFWV